MSLVLTHVINTLTSSVTLFENYDFNSMTKFQGKYLAAGTSGLFQLDDAASTEEVTGTLATGALDFGSEFQKRVTDFFLGMRSEGDITLTVTVDEQNTYSYTISPYSVPELKQRRGWIGKGAKGKYWLFEVQAGAPFDYDTMNIAAVAVSRRL